MKRIAVLFFLLCLTLCSCTLLRSPKIPQDQSESSVSESESAISSESVPESEPAVSSESEPESSLASAEEETSYFSPGTLLDITGKVTDSSAPPIALRFVDEDTLGIEVMSENGMETLYYRISQDAKAEPGESLFIAHPNSLDRIVPLPDGGNVRITEDQTRVIHELPSGLEWILLDGTSASETYWILTARGRWGAVSSNTGTDSTGCYLLDLEQNTSRRMEIEGTTILSDIEGDLLLFSRTNTLHAAYDTNVYLYDAAADNLRQFDMGTENGASDVVLSTGGNYLLSCDSWDEDAGTHHFIVYQTADESKICEFQLEQVFHLADSTFQNMAICENGRMIALIANTDYQDFTPHILLYYIPE
ncbi:MAG: hypothetical protein ACOX6P_06510 [Candidatus Merdivicinus sp.]|jgi:hypothetical protein